MGDDILIYLLFNHILMIDILSISRETILRAMLQDLSCQNYVHYLANDIESGHTI